MPAPSAIYASWGQESFRIRLWKWVEEQERAIARGVFTPTEEAGVRSTAAFLAAWMRKCG